MNFFFIELASQRELAAKKAAIQTPVIESSIPNHRDKNKPAPAPAVQRGQWASAGGAVKSEKVKVKSDKNKTNNILNLFVNHHSFKP